MLSISGLVVEFIVAIDVTRVRFPADALLYCLCSSSTLLASLLLRTDRGVDGDLAQMVERSLSMREALGSMPRFSTFIFFLEVGSRNKKKFELSKIVGQLLL